MYWKEYLLINTIIDNDEVKNNFSTIFPLLIFDYQFLIIIFAFNYEKQREKYHVFLSVLVFSFILLTSFKGIPFVNNYCAFYGKIEVEDGSRFPSEIEIHSIVVPKNKVQQAENEIIKDLPDNVDFIWNKGYIFLQAALIDGYKSNQNSGGFISYIGCLPYYALEKLIRVLLLFLFPLVIGVIFIERKNDKNGKNEEKWKTTIDKLERKNDAFKDTIKIIKKYQLFETPKIYNSLLAFEKGLFESKLTIVKSSKNWFDAQSLLFAFYSYSNLISWTKHSLYEKTYDIIVDNFNNYHFSSSYDKSTIENAKVYLSILEKEKCINVTTLKYLLNLIPKNEIEIDYLDFV